MSKPPTIPEIATGEAKDLFDHYRTGQIGQSEEIELFQLIQDIAQRYEKTFKLREVLRDNFDYSAFEIKRLDNEYHKWLKQQIKEDAPELKPEGPASPAIQQKAKEIGTGATKALLGELQELGNVLVLEHAKMASDRGESLKDYVLKSVEIRETYGDQMEALQQENEQLRALCGLFVEAIKPQFKQLAAARMYLDWVTSLMQLQVMGYVPEQKWVDDVTARIEQALQVRIV
jgi:hypothetical protein